MEVAADQRDIGCFHRDIRARPNRHPDIRLSKRRRIVNAIPDHTNNIPTILKRFDLSQLAIRADARDHTVNPNHPAHRLRGTLAVPREHHDIDTQPLEVLDGIYGCLFDPISNAKCGREVTINGEEDDCLAIP
jgi:hypothetical protein